MVWIPPLNGIAMCQNGYISPSNEEGIHITGLGRAQFEVAA